jgi:hypothetical protein
MDVNIRSKMTTNGIHAGHTDKSRRRLLFPLDPTVVERADSPFPGLDNSLLHPRQDATFEAFISDREILSTVVESKPLGRSTRCHPASKPSAFFEYDCINAMVQ